MSYYNSRQTDTEEARRFLIPVGVALISIAVFAVIFGALFPWESIPSPEVCTNEPIYKGILGRIDGYRLDCKPDTTLRDVVGLGAALFSLGVTALVTLKAIVVANTNPQN